MSKYQDIIFDIDGTAILNLRHAMPSPRLISAIAQAKSKLHLFAASGRSTVYGAPILKALGLSDPCIVAGGTTIMDPATGDIIEQAPLSIDAISQVQVVSSPFGYDVHLGSTPTTIRPATHGQTVSTPHPYVLLEKVTDTHITPLMEALAALPNIVAATSPDFGGGHTIQVTNHDATKEHRIKKLLTQLGISRQQAIGVGDGNNDNHLFASVGYRIAMGNASDMLKSIANEVAPTVEEDGLAQVIERFAARA